MGAVHFVSFHQLPAIAADNLGGCSVVIIVPVYGAIVGHIPPLPSDSSTDPLGYDNVRSMMGHVFGLYNHYRNYFPTAQTVIVCARWRNGLFGVPDQLEIIRGCFQELGQNPNLHTYDIPPDTSRQESGTVMVYSQANMARPSIYVEGRAISGAL